MIGGSIAFWKGVRLWQMAGSCRAQPQGMNQPKAGVTRRRGRLDNRGPNFLYQLAVNTWIPAIEGDHVESKAVLTGMGRQATRQVYSAKTLELLVDNTGGTKGLGQLAWCENMDNYRTVTNTSPGGPGASFTTGAAPSGWAPAAGELVIVANPTTGEGFATTVLGYTAGTLTVNAERYTNDRDQADGEPVKEPQPVNTQFRVYECQFYYDKVKFVQMVDPPAAGSSEDRWSVGLQYIFMSETGIITAAGAVPDFT